MSKSSNLLMSLNLSSFKIIENTNVTGIFSGESNLTIIYKSSRWNNSLMATAIFINCGTITLTMRS